MEAVMDIQIQRTAQSQLGAIDWDHLEFGRYLADHMFVCSFSNGEWQQPVIKPVQPLLLSPVTLALHYGQSIFEGMKAFYMQNGSVNIFRMEKHHERLNRSLQRMCMPTIPYELYAGALETLIRLDKAWIPKSNDNALYVRPFVFASEARFGVKVSEEYQFIIVTGPVSMAFQQPIRVKVERNYIRAAKGGTGFAKCAGNYGGAFYPTQKAREEGFDQVIWTDASSHEYVEESGMMNLMFVIDGTLVTPPLSDSILDGITRDSLLQIAPGLDIPVAVRSVSLTEIKTAFRENRISEAFGTGTAAVVAPISTIGIDGEMFELPTYSDQAVMFRLKNKLESMRTGKEEDRYGWNYEVKS
jgi:branched-chain amino acid aminotransferase